MIFGISPAFAKERRVGSTRVNKHFSAQVMDDTWAGFGLLIPKGAFVIEQDL
jgi:hypothetical protein